MKTVFLILKTRKRAKSALFLALLLAPPAAYLLWIASLYLLDSYRGDGLMRYQYAYESYYHFADLLWSDARQALPVFYLAGLVLWLEVHLLTSYSQWGGFFAAAVAGALTGFVAAAAFVEMSPAVIVPSALSAMLLSLAISAAVRPPPPQV